MKNIPLVAPVVSGKKKTCDEWCIEVISPSIKETECLTPLQRYYNKNKNEKGSGTYTGKVIKGSYLSSWPISFLKITIRLLLY